MGFNSGFKGLNVFMIYPVLDHRLYWNKYH